MSAPDNTTVRDIAAAAVHVPFADLDPAALATDVPIVAVRRSVNRSSKAALQLTEAGHAVSNMAGGMKAWHRADLPMVTDDGRPGSV